MFKKNDTLRNVLFAMLACVALMFAGCNNATVEEEPVANINSGDPVSLEWAKDAIRTQKAGTVVKIVLEETFAGIGNKGNGNQDLTDLANEIRNNSNVMVDLDLSKCWKDGQFGSQVLEDPNGALEILRTGTVGQYFRNLTNLKRISLPFVIGEIGPEAFYGCKGLEEVVINFWFKADVDKTRHPACNYLYDDTFVLATVNDRAFYNCINFKGFSLVSDPDTSAPDADHAEYAFPVSINHIGRSAFENCYALTSNSANTLRFWNTRNDKEERVIWRVRTEEDFDVLPEAMDSWDAKKRNKIGIHTTDYHPLRIDEDAFKNCTSIATVDFTNKTGLQGIAKETISGNWVERDPADTTTQVRKAMTTGIYKVYATNLRNTNDWVSTRLGYTTTTPAPNTIDRTARNVLEYVDDVYKDVLSDGVFDGCTSLSNIIVAGAKIETFADRSDMTQADVDNAEAKFAQIKRFGARSFQYTALSDKVIAALLHTTDEDAGVEEADGNDKVDLIGLRAFFGNKVAKNVRLPHSITVAKDNLGDGAFANTSVEYIRVHDNTGFYSVQNKDKNDPFSFWDGALVKEADIIWDTVDPTKPKYVNPTVIYAWYVSRGRAAGDLTQIPDADLHSQNPTTGGKVYILGDRLGDIRGDAFYNNKDLWAVRFPTSLAGVDSVTLNTAPTAMPAGLTSPVTVSVPGIGATAFANCEYLVRMIYAGNMTGTVNGWYDGTATKTKDQEHHFGDLHKLNTVNQGNGAFVNIGIQEIECADGVSKHIHK